MKRAVAVALLLLAHAAWAKGDKKSADSDDDSGDDTSISDEDSDEDKGDVKVSDEDTDKTPTNTLPAKQDLTGHDLGSHKKANEFERDRFFVDKIDTKDTRNGTLVQGSITSTSFAYSESGGSYGSMIPGSNASSFSRLFTDLRLQTDFRHISASAWEARVDARLRFVDTPSPTSDLFNPATPTHVQSGLTGQNEYELRELWLIRNGVRTDVIIGRQFIADLAAVKIDGVRIDYAQSKEFTLLGFGGLYPLRGSRSLTTDYVDLKDSSGKSVGQFVGAAGFGAAYRTDLAYGSFGGVVLDPVQGGETPRVFATANGYWRFGPTLDLYHYVILDLVRSSGPTSLGGGSTGITNLSLGANFKPTQRLRATASLNRVDTDTLNLQANAFLTQPGAATNVINNEVFFARLATTQVRGSVSAGLGELQRFEITMALAYRDRPAFSLTSPDGTSILAAIPDATSVEVYGSITDRRSIYDMRLGADFVRTYAVGSSTSTTAFSRSEVLAVRAFAARDLDSGKGEWDGEITYATTKDSNIGTTCMSVTTATDLANCYGGSNGTILSAGGTFYYRFNSDWFGIVSAYLSETTLARAGMPADPAILGLTGFLRLAYRY